MTHVSVYRAFYTPFRRYDDYDGRAGIYGLVDPRTDDIFYVGKAHGDVRDRIKIHFGLRPKETLGDMYMSCWVPQHRPCRPNEVGSSPRVQEVIASIRKDGLQPRAVRVLRCPEWALDVEERRAIGLGQALDGLVNFHAGGRQFDCDDWHEQRGLLPVGDIDCVLRCVRVSQDNEVTFIFEWGSDFYFQKIPLDNAKWKVLNDARIRVNVAHVLGVDPRDMSLDDAVSYARFGPRLSLPVQVRVIEFARNRAGQPYRRYDIYERQKAPEGASSSRQEGSVHSSL